ncbi:MAG: class I SAM-dependent methyltransferase [Candidatus Bathyarchaeia archaeon]
MKDSLFSVYSRKHVHFYDEESPALLNLGLALSKKMNEKPMIIDLGCGDGRLIFALHRKGLLNDVGGVVGVDISDIRIQRLRREMPFVRGIVSDALSVRELPDSSFDYVICSQLIEHVEDDKALVSEIWRLLKSGGLAYVSSVIKKWYAIYFYFNKGSFRLDPTHVREYSSIKEFTEMFEEKGFEVINVITQRVMYPLTDLVMRLFIKFGLIEPDVIFYEERRIVGRLRKLRIPVFGYRSIEALVKKIG